MVLTDEGTGELMLECLVTEAEVEIRWGFESKSIKIARGQWLMEVGQEEDLSPVPCRPYRLHA